MKSYFKQLFSFNRRQQRGISVLLILLLAVATAGWWYPGYDEPETAENFFEEKFQREASLFFSEHTDQQKEVAPHPDPFSPGSVESHSEPVLFQFNPNELDDAGWRKLGLSARQVKSIRNFMAKGGKFYRKEDVGRLYCLSAEEYRKLEPYISIPAPKADSMAARYKKTEKSSAPVMVEVNGADSAMLTLLRGIGPAFASRIVKYRRRLGGFVKKEQLLEIYGMDTSRYKLVEPMITIDTSLVVRININKASFKELLRHPYLEYYIVKAICNEREKRQGFSSKADLLSLKLIYRELYVKIEPYLCTTDEEQ